jgi:RNA polymerase sigma-70 factor (ECF subfamily)
VNPTADESLTSLVARARRGETRAFEVLARRHLRAAYATALALLGRPEDAEDVAQDALLTAFERLEDCREPERFSGWLLQIVRNRALNALDRRRVRTGAGSAVEADTLPAPPSPVGAGELREQLLAGLAQLGPVPREVLLLQYLEGWTHGEIAAALGVSEEMSRQHLMHARRAMRAALPGQEPVEEHHAR